MRRAVRSLLLTVLAAFLCAFAVAQAGSAPNAGFQSLASRAAAARDADRLQEAAALYQQAVQLRPQWAEGWWSLGTILYDSDQYAAAAPAFRRVVALDPKNGTAHLMLGLCEYELGQDDAALGDIDAAKRLGIRDDVQLEQVMVYHEAMLLLRKRMFESANDVLGFLIRKGVRSREVFLALGMSALLMRPADLPADGTGARDVVLHVGEAEALSIIRKPDEARRAYQQLVAANPTVPNLHYAYGRFLLAVREPDDAVQQFKEELKNQPEHARARLQIAAISYRINSAAGIPYAEEAVRLQPDFPFGHYLLGLLYLDTGDAQRAITQLKTATEMAPGAAQFFFALGSAYAKAGDKQDAARARAAFVRLNAQSAESSGPTSYADQTMGLANLSAGAAAPPQR